MKSKATKKIDKNLTKKSSVKKTASKAAKTTVKRVAKPISEKQSTKVKSAKRSSNSLMPSVGSLAPDFSLPSDTDGEVSLKKYRGKNIVLYFYPKDDTPGCTREACSFQENKQAIKKLDATVIGVSPDNIVRHEKFRKKYGLEFILVADEDHKVAESYGVWVEKNNYGKKYMGVQRSTFLIDGNGVVSYVWPKVSVDGHTEEVLRELERL